MTPEGAALVARVRASVAKATRHPWQWVEAMRELRDDAPALCDEIEWLAREVDELWRVRHALVDDVADSSARADAAEAKLADLREVLDAAHDLRCGRWEDGAAQGRLSRAIRANSEAFAGAPERNRARAMAAPGSKT